MAYSNRHGPRSSVSAARAFQGVQAVFARCPTAQSAPLQRAADAINLFGRAHGCRHSLAVVQPAALTVDAVLWGLAEPAAIERFVRLLADAAVASGTVAVAYLGPAAGNARSVEIVLGPSTERVREHVRTMAVFEAQA